MKTAVLTMAAIVLASGSALAAPGKSVYRYDGRGHVTPYERVMISNSAKKLAQLKARAWRDGRITFLERFQINLAERRHAALVAKARRT